jgi:branched-subunit amino acid aminotransferase/4-amino-4-deoxychorismate lyase
VASIDLDQWINALARHFAAMNRLSEELNLPEDACEEVAEQNGFCVLRLKVKRERELITLIGHTPIVSPGEYASASGQWVTDREHGRQLRTVFVRISPPTPPDRHRAIPCLGHGQQWALILSTADGG